MSEVRCAYAGCKIPRPVGQFLCADHRGKPKTLKESIAAGPKFEQGFGNLPCVACAELPKGLDGHDMKTALCRPCWRAWRFSMERKS